MRAVLDANVLISALLSKTGAPPILVERWLAVELELVVGEQLLEEVRRTLTSPKLRDRFDAGQVEAFVELLRELAEPVPDPQRPPPSRRATRATTT